MAVGVLVIVEQGGDVGGVHDQDVSRENLLLGHEMTTFRLREFHLEKGSVKNSPGPMCNFLDKPQELLTDVGISCVNHSSVSAEFSMVLVLTLVSQGRPLP